MSRNLSRVLCKKKIHKQIPRLLAKRYQRSLGWGRADCAHVKDSPLTHFYPPDLAGLILYARYAGHSGPVDMPQLMIGYVQQPVRPTGISQFSPSNRR